MTRIERILVSLGLKIERKRGNRAWILCPFHLDHSPTNFFVRLNGPRQGQSHCFSCRQGGSLVELVTYIRGCSEDQAKAFIELLGKGFEPPRARLKISKRPPRPSRTRFQMPDEVVFEPLETWVSLARSYAIERGITPEEVDRFGIGYAVDGFLNGRIVLPCRDQNGTPHGYSARTFVDAEERYLTPKESDNPDFGVLFGEHTWPVLSERRAIVVVEGSLNGLASLRALHDYRVDVGGLGGSDVNPIHAIKLATFPIVVFLTDPDMAGDKCAAGLGSMLGRYVRTTRPRLPEKKDALDVGREYLRDVLTHSLSQFGVEPVRVRHNEG